MEKYEVVIATAPDKDYPVAELWINDIMIAEVNQEKGEEELEIELFSFNPNKRVICDYKSFIQAINKCKERLLDKPTLV